MLKESSYSSRAENLLKQSIQWVRTHQEQFWAISGTLMGAVLLIYFTIHRSQAQNEEAWIQLGVAQSHLAQGQYDQAAKALDQWASRFQGTSATAYAKFLRGDLLYNTSDYARAAEVYGDLAQTGRPAEVRPLALAAQSSSEEMAGHLPQASAAAQQFLDRYPDHFLAASMYVAQARLAELSGNNANASALYDRFVILYPQSPWTALAKTRLQALSASPAPIKK